MKYDFSDKYELINNESINEGTFGEIYSIKDKRVKTEFILKKIKNEYYFNKEINSLLDVKGTNIVNIFDWYYNQNEDYFYLILEKMDGDLNKMLLDKYKNGMPSKLIRKIFLQLNSGLKTIIKCGITHRDLKPGNILFSYTNDKKTDFIVKISDFGLSTDLKSKTEMASNVGTVYFIAPEIMTGDEYSKYSNKCDLYSIGMILYVLKSGDILCKNLDNFLNNLNNNENKNEFDDEKLNILIKKLIVNDPHKRMEWKDYFDDPFFKENEEDIQENEECKIKNYFCLDKKMKNELNENKNCKLILNNISNRRIKK